MTEASPWWAPHRHADRRKRLLQRNAITAAIRDWFVQRDFLEVETAALQVSPGNETHLSAFATEAILPDGSRSPLYLHTSPEFACKKLLAAGEQRIFSLGKVWRNRERGALHHPEFTMLEWYRAGETYESLMQDCASLLALAAEIAGATTFAFRGRATDPLAEPERLTVADAFARHAGLPRWPRTARPTATRSTPLSAPPACAPRLTTRGPISSAGSWSSASNRPSGRAAQRSSTNTRSRRPR
jgi:lysyl-tRNA synthetase class 2